MAERNMASPLTLFPCLPPRLDKRSYEATLFSTTVRFSGENMASSSPSIRRLSFSVLLLICFFGVSRAGQTDWIQKDVLINAPLLTSKIATNRTIIVGRSDKEDFNSVQAAIDSVPEGNSDWIIIHVRAGNYREKINIPENKPYIFMRGNGKGKTFIAWNDTSTDNGETATLSVKARHFIAFGISFKNDAPVGLADGSNNRAVAAFVAADMVAFYHCGFYSLHNTLFDSKGRHYYENCYITGSIDFIFGHGKSMFKSCEIFVVADKRHSILGSITAQNRQTADEETGFIFLKGKVYGIGTVYLGRARAAFSRVIFAKTYLSRTIHPEGWTNWSYDDTINNLALGEYHCHGPGADTIKRVKWSQQLSEEEAAQFLSIDFIDGNEWLPVY